MKFFQDLKKLTKETEQQPDPMKFFLKAYSKMALNIIKQVQTFLVKYAILMAFYSFIIFNVYTFAGFEPSILFTLALILTRIQLKRQPQFNLQKYEELKRKYIELKNQEIRGKS